MTVPSIPSYSMNIQAGASLLKDITKAMAAVKASPAQKPKHPNSRRLVAVDAAPVAPAPGDTTMINAMLGTMFLDMLFGMPLFSGLGEATQGLAHLGMLGAVDDSETAIQKNSKVFAPAPRAPKATSFDEVLLAAQQTEYLKAVAAQKSKMRQMVMLRQMMATLMAQALEAEQDEESGKAGSSGSGELVPDVLRDPKLARFKQNRQSISCIRTLFKRESNVTVVQFRAPRYGYAA